MPGAGEPWDDLEYQQLLAQFPLDGGSPTGADAEAIANRLGRSVGAIKAQWDDAHSYCLGRDSSVASDQLKSFIDQNRLCP